MRVHNVFLVACLTASFVMAIQADQNPAAPAGTPGQGGGGRQGGGRAGGAAAGANRAPIGGTLTPAKPDERG